MFFWSQNCSCINILQLAQNVWNSKVSWLNICQICLKEIFQVQSLTTKKVIYNFSILYVSKYVIIIELLLMSVFDNFLKSILMKCIYSRSWVSSFSYSFLSMLGAIMELVTTVIFVSKNIFPLNPLWVLIRLMGLIELFREIYVWNRSNFARHNRKNHCWITLDSFFSMKYYLSSWMFWEIFQELEYFPLDPWGFFSYFSLIGRRSRFRRSFYHCLY